MNNREKDFMMLRKLFKIKLHNDEGSLEYANAHKQYNIIFNRYGRNDGVRWKSLGNKRKCTQRIKSQMKGYRRAKQKGDFLTKRSSMGFK